MKQYKFYSTLFTILLKCVIRRTVICLYLRPVLLTQTDVLCCVLLMLVMGFIHHLPEEHLYSPTCTMAAHGCIFSLVSPSKTNSLLLLSNLHFNITTQLTKWSKHFRGTQTHISNDINKKIHYLTIIYLLKPKVYVYVEKICIIENTRKHQPLWGIRYEEILDAQ